MPTSHKASAAARVALLLTLIGAPTPAARPRVSRWGTYYPKTYTTWMKEAAPQVAEQAPPSPLEGPLRVDMHVVAKRPANPANPWPRGDVDNYAKGPLDVITKSERVWSDDSQVVELHVTKRYAVGDERPRVMVQITPKEDYT
jgi:Holliday junction resolvase RusA-like endonuclease